MDKKINSLKLEELYANISEIPAGHITMMNKQRMFDVYNKILNVADELFKGTIKQTEYTGALRTLPIILVDDDEQSALKLFLKSLKEIIDAMRTDVESDSSIVASSNVKRPMENSSKKIFIVHGHDDGMKNATFRTIETLGLKPIILHEQADRGKTIIEKFELYSDVSFAVVLLSPDDICSKSSGPPENVMSRARQNVVLELGFFLGKLGRDRVLPLYRKIDNFEIPTDLEGILFVPYDQDDGSWRLRLVRELKACGYEMDLSKLA